MNAVKKKFVRYFRGKFQADLSAGLTVAMIVIPQSMAYAAIVGINPIYGLFTAIIPTIIGAIFSSFPFLIMGPTNPTSLVTASVLLSYANRSNYFEFVLALAIIAGIVNIIFGLLRLGYITRYISNSVLVGFLTAAGFLIIGNQLGNLFGVELSREGGIWGIIVNLFTDLSGINLYTLIVSAFSIGLMLVLRSINRKIPAALITIISASLIVFLTGWGQSQNVQLVSDTGLPEQIRLGFHIPSISFEELTNIALAGAAVALFGFMETTSIAKSMSQFSGKPFDPSRQMFAQGLACFTGGLFQCMPASGSPSRTVINVVNGAKTRISAIISGIGVLIFLLLFSRLIGYIPISALAAVVIVSSAGLINFALIKLTWQSAFKSRIVMIITFVSALILPLEYAIYLGILTTLLIYLGESSHINLSTILEDSKGNFIELPVDKIKEGDSRIVIVNIEGDLYFAAVEDLKSQIQDILESSPVKVLILRFRRTHLLASTAIMALDQLIQAARKQNIKILFCGVQKEVLAPLKDAGVLEIIGESHIFLADDQIFGSTQRALEKAKTIISNQ